MNDVLVTLTQQYQEDLIRFLEDPSERALYGAYEVGRQAAREGVGALGLVALHLEAVERAVRDSAERTRTFDRAMVFLTEALAVHDLAAEARQELLASLRNRVEILLAAEVRRASELSATLQAVQQLRAERGRLLASLLDAEEKERQRIAAEVHDDSLQVLSAVMMRLDVLSRMAGDDSHSRAFVTETRETVQLAAARLRQLLFELRAPELDEGGLAAAIEARLDQLARETSIECHLQDRLEAPPPREIGLILYRILQEALANVRKHSGAGRAEVTLARDDGGYLVRVEDNGRGFDPDRAPAMGPRHIGVSVMRERAETAGGWIRLESSPGAGTAVEVWLPGKADERGPPD